MKTLTRIFLVTMAVCFAASQAHAVLFFARAYDPNLQRWLQRDPLGEEGGSTIRFSVNFQPTLNSDVDDADQELPFESWGGANLYNYVENNPVNLSDPLGLSPSLNPQNEAWAGEALETAEQAGARNAARDALEQAGKKGTKCLSEYLEHQRKLAEAQERLQKLEKLLEKTKGPKAQQPVKDAIRDLLKSIKGHEKEIRQKWPNGAPPS